MLMPILYNLKFYYFETLLSQQKQVSINYIYLAKNTSSSISTSITYIVKSTKMQKGKPSEMSSPLLKNDITKFLNL